jgi:RecB family exonuclease
VSVEEKLLEEMDDIESFGKKFKGFIDMVIKTPDEKYHIIDWKTCSWGWSRDKKSDPMTTYQLTYYKNYFSRKHNINPNQIETYFVLLKRTAKLGNVEVMRVTSGQKKTTNALKVLENAVINIERGNYIKNRLNCKYCKFHKTEHCT